MIKTIKVENGDLPPLFVNITTKSNSIRQDIEVLAISNFFRLKSVNYAKNPDITCHLELFQKENIEFADGYGKISIRFSNDIFYIWNSLSRSYIKTNLQKPVAEGRLASGDRSSLLLIGYWLKICALFFCFPHLHSSSVKIGGTNSALFIGISGSGKTTLAVLLKKICSAKIIDDDVTYLAVSNKLIYSFSQDSLISFPNEQPGHNEKHLSEKNLFGVPKWIFFVKKDKNIKSRVIPICFKEAFERICFVSSAIIFKDRKRQQKRIEILERLIKQCRCFYLLNRRDIKENPLKLKDLFLPILKS